MQVYRGRIQYQLDPNKCDALVALGLDIDERDPNIWLRDQFGAPMPVTVEKQDAELAMFLLKQWKPERYGSKGTVDVNVKGGVLVVGMQAANPQELNALEDRYRREGRQAVTFEEGDEV